MGASFSDVEVQDWLTRTRFGEFEVAAGGDRAVASALYNWNAEVSGALLGVIHHVEVLVRNSIHAQMKAHRDSDSLFSWLTDPKVLQPAQRRKVDGAIELINQGRKTLTEDRVIAGVSFGFWTSLVGRAYEDLWRDVLNRAFAHGSGKRNDIAGPMNRISQARNRVAHHRPVITLPISDRHDDLLVVAAAVDPRAKMWIEAESDVPQTLARAPIPIPAAAS